LGAGGVGNEVELEGGVVDVVGQVDATEAEQAVVVGAGGDVAFEQGELDELLVEGDLEGRGAVECGDGALGDQFVAAFGEALNGPGDGLKRKGLGGGVGRGGQDLFGEGWAEGDESAKGLARGGCRGG
jgi:hypothetical protein